MKRIRDVILIVLIAAPLSAMEARADEPVAYQPATAGFRPHVPRYAGGQIDWTEGVIITHGKGLATGVDTQAELMARRAAELDAARNAVAVAAGIPVDATGVASSFANGRLLLEGWVKGHEIDEERWLPAESPPEYHVTMRVPLWGLNGVSSVFRGQHRRRRQPQAGARLPLVVDRANVSDSVLVIDARGTGLEPCLFPTIVTDAGETLYDINAVTNEQVKVKPLARYVETDLAFEDIQAALDGGAPLPGLDPRPCVRLASMKLADDPTPTPAPSAAPTPAPSTEPGATPVPEAPAATAGPGASPGPTVAPSDDAAAVSKRRRKRSVVKAVNVAGTVPTQIVVTRETADRLRKSAEGASLLRESDVVIVVDSVAAGIQGRSEPLGEGTAIVLADAP